MYKNFIYLILYNLMKLEISIYSWNHHINLLQKLPYVLLEYADFCLCFLFFCDTNTVWFQLYEQSSQTQKQRIEWCLPVGRGGGKRNYIWVYDQSSLWALTNNFSHRIKSMHMFIHIYTHTHTYTPYLI